jgi:hypothetical protein
VFALGCGSTKTFQDDGGGPDGSSPDDSGVVDSSMFNDTGTLDAAPPVGEVYGHSPTSLYKLEPFSKTIATLGNFDCLVACGMLQTGCGMWDIAIDEKGNMIGTGVTALSQIQAAGTLVSIDKATAHCTTIKTLAASSLYPNSLTFVPAGTVDANAEALVGYNGDQYVRIDTTTGAITTIGALNPSQVGTWYSSGDIVSIKGGKTYLTAKPSTDPMYAGVDTILEVDPKTGVALKAIGSTGYTKLWGLGFWAGTAYGFSAAGQLCAIDLMTGKGTPIPEMGIPPNLAWWGAGVTTVAPIAPPK